MDAILKGGNHVIGIDEVELGGDEEIPAGHNRRTIDIDGSGGLIANVVGAEDQPLDVQDNIRNVLANSGQGLELVLHAFDVNSLDSGTVKRGQQDSAHRIAERITETALKRLNRKAGHAIGDALNSNLRLDEL